MHGPNCNHANPGNAKFCSNCGVPLSPALRPIHKAHRGQDHYPHEDGVAAFTTLTSSKAHGRLVGYLAAAAVPAFGFGVASLVHSSTVLFSSFFVGICAASFVQWLFHVKEGEYSELPGAKDGQGQHRCVHCGGRGIWKRTPYKSSVTIAACSNCKTELFRG